MDDFKLGFMIGGFIGIGIVFAFSYFIFEAFFGLGIELLAIGLPIVSAWHLIFVKYLIVVEERKDALSQL